MSGPAVGEARLAARDLALIAQTLERAAIGAAETLLRGHPGARGRKPAVIEEQCRLFLVAWGIGSAVATFELGSGEDLLSDLATQALDTVFATIEAARRPDLSHESADPARAAVARSLHPLERLFERGIETIELRADGRMPRSATYDRHAADAMASLVGEVAETRLVVVRGRLERLDAHDRLEGTLWEANGTAWRCTFRPGLEPLLGQLWRCWVEVEGRTSVSHKPRGLIAEDIRPSDEVEPPTLLTVLSTMEPLAETFPEIEELRAEPFELS